MKTKRVKPTRYNKGTSRKFTMVYITKSKYRGAPEIWSVNFWVGSQGFSLEPVVIEDNDDKEHVKFQAKMLRLAFKKHKEHTIKKHTTK